ncbi:MAG: NifB/NifX family molybdenum-iron cluster-binding protein [Sphaerochaetaceae bacterium]|jgi:predicted Fe-Mo cluster-binding NifX family protein
MKIAVPTHNDRLNAHFGHCKTFTFFEVDLDKKEILSKSEKEAPKHEPGVLPRFLADQGVKTIIAGGMGQSAISLFQQYKIEVIVGAPIKNSDELIKDFLEGTLESVDNLCDH